MKILGNSKKGHRVLMVTEFEFDIISTALFEYAENMTIDGSVIARELNTVNNRLNKAVRKFEESPVLQNGKTKALKND